MPYTQDKFLARFNVPSDARSFVVRQSSTDYQVSITAGNYFGHDELSATHPGFWYAVVAALNAHGSLSGTWSVSAASPTLSSGMTNGGVRLACTAAFSLSFAHASWTMDKGLFGYPSNSVVTPTTVNGVFAGGTYGATMPYTRSTDWLCRPEAKDRAVTDKRSFPIVPKLVSSDVDPLLAVEMIYGNSALEYVRTYKTGRILAGHVFGERCLEAGYAATAGVAIGDTCNGFAELVWNRAKLLNGTANDGDIIIVHNDVSDLKFSTHDYDIARFEKPAHREALRNLMADRQLNGEVYSIETEFRLKVRNYRH